MSPASASEPDRAAGAGRSGQFMAEHTVKAFTEELDALSNEIARMGGLAEAAVNDCITAVVRRDTRLAQDIIGRDKEIDHAQREVERRAIRLMALRHPF